MSPVHVESQGRGAPLLLLHGWGLNLRVFDGLVPELAHANRVVRLDLPGHGRSAWDPRGATLAGLVEIVQETLAAEAPGERWSLLGWSLGGQIALGLATDHPDLIDRLVLVATTPRHTRAPDWPHGTDPSQLSGFAERLAGDWRATVADFLELQVRGSADGQRVLEALRAALLDHGEAQPRALRAGLETLASTDVRPRLAAALAPALVLAGQYDRVTSPAASRALAEALPAARYIEYRRAGHAPFLSHAREVGAAVREFLS